MAVEMLEAAPALLVLSGGRPLARAHPHRHPHATSRPSPPTRTWRGWVSSTSSRLGLRDPRRPRRPGARPGRPARSSRRSRCRTTFAQDGVGGHQGFEYSRSRQPDPRRARGVRRLARGGPPRARVRQRPGRRGQRAAAASPPGERVRARQRRLRRHVPADRQGVGPARACTWTAVDLTDLDALADGWPDDTAMVWLETPTNPLLTCVDIEAVAARRPRPRARWSSSTTRSPRRTCSSRSRSAPTSSCTRPPSTSAGTATWSAGSSPLDDDELAERLRFTQNAAGAVPGAVRLLPRAARREDAGRAHGPPLRERPGRRRPARRPPGRRAGAVPAAARPPRPRRRGQADARLRRDGQLHAARRRRGAPSGSPPAPSCSRSPSRSARSRASSSTPAR